MTLVLDTSILIDIQRKQRNTLLSLEKAADIQLQMIKEISERITSIKTDADAMTEERRKANNLDSPKKQAHAYCENVKPFFEKIRYEADKLESLVDDETWPLPKYREMLFLK